MRVQFNGSGNEFIAQTIGRQEANISFENMSTPNFYSSLPNNGNGSLFSKQRVKDQTINLSVSNGKVIMGELVDTVINKQITQSPTLCTLRPNGGFESCLRGKTAEQVCLFVFM